MNPRVDRVVILVAGIVLGTLLAGGLIVGCLGDGDSASSPAVAEKSGGAPPVTAAGLKVSAPLDLSGIVRQVHFAYRQTGADFVGGGDTYSVRVTPEAAITVTPRDGDRTGAPATLATAFVGRGGADLTALSGRMDNPDDGGLAIWRNPASPVIERLVNSERGIEQSWRFEEYPDGAGDLVVRIGVTGLPFAGETEAGLHFADRTGLGLRYGRATWVDAEGNHTDVPAVWTGSAIELRIAENVLTGSAFPAVLDPMITPELNFGELTFVQYWTVAEATAAFNGTNYLVVYAYDAGTSFEIVGTRVSPTLAILDPAGITISSRTVQQTALAVAAGGSDFLVVWYDSGTGGGDTYGARVSAGGVVLDPAGIAIASSSPSIEGTPAVASDGSGYLVAYTKYVSVAQSATQYLTMASKVGADGTVILREIPVESGTGSTRATNPAVAFDGANYLVAWKKYNTSAGFNGVYAARVSPAGVPLDAPIRVCDNNCPSADYPAAASDGTGFLVTWDDSRNGTSGPDVFGARVRGDGVVLDPGGFAVAVAPNNQAKSSVAFDGTNYFVAWRNYEQLSYTVRGARVSTAGVTLDPSGIAILPDYGGSSWNTVNIGLACDGANCLTAWPASMYNAYCARVSSATGTLVDSPPMRLTLRLGPNAQSGPRADFDGTNYLVAWFDKSADPGHPQDWGTNLLAARLTPGGVLLDPAGIPIPALRFPDNDNGGVLLIPQVAWNGSAYLVSDGNYFAWRVTVDGTVVTPGLSFPGGSCVLAGTPGQETWMAVCGDQYTEDITPPGCILCPPMYDTHYLVRRTTVQADGSMSTATGEIAGENVYWYGKAVVADGATYVDAIALGGTVHSFVNPQGLYPALAAGNGDVLLVWRVGDPDHDIHAALRSGPSDITVSAATGEQNYPTAAFDGTNFVVAWTDDRSGSGTDIYGTKVAPDGTVLYPDGVPLSREPGDEADPGLAVDNAGRLLLTYSRFDAGLGVGRAKARFVTWGEGGDACAGDGDCATNHCVDGVCCDTACGGGAPGDCLSCAVPGHEGTCTVEPAGTLCRPAADLCDTAESCDGTGAACPADGVAPAGTECRPVRGECDVAESCTGTSAACPQDTFAPTSSLCRPAAGPCDKDDYCPGTGPVCDADARYPVSHLCRTANGPCDVDDYCEGDADCPQYFAANTTVCRASAGTCDLVDKCTGTSAECPADTFRPATYVCRTSAGVCDVAETCTGSSAACPANGFLPSSTVCRAATDLCDKPDTCTGSSSSCPADAKWPAGTLCREAAGPCDVTETCNGTSKLCPTDGFRPSGFECRASAGVCDVAEACSGSAPACPADGFRPDGTSCPDGYYCDGAETCQGGHCVPPGDPCQAAQYCDEDVNECRASTGVNPILDGAAGWTDSGLTVAPGGTLSIHATGTVTLTPGGTPVGPDGAAPPCGTGCPLPSANGGALVGRIGTAKGAPFVVGSNYSATTTEAGSLFLAVNDAAPADNGGLFSAEANFNSGPATPIELLSFTATGEAGAVRLDWETATEADNAGFHLWRADSETGTYLRITTALIPSEGSPTGGATYAFTDRDVKAGQTYWYKLEDVDIHGNSAYHGPANATVLREPLFGCGMASGGTADSLVGLLFALGIALARKVRRR